MATTQTETTVIKVAQHFLLHAPIFKGFTTLLVFHCLS